MRLTRTRGFNRYAQRDFDQERADLNEGYHNYAQETETNINDVLTSDVYTLEQKKQFLRAAKIDLMQKSQDYSEKMQQINEEEAQHLMDSMADTYCGLYDAPLPQSNQTPTNYCGTAAKESADNEYAFLSIHLNGLSVLDFLSFVVSFYITEQQIFEWEEPV